MTSRRTQPGYRSIGNRTTSGNRLTSEVTEVTAVTDPSPLSGEPMTATHPGALTALPPLIPVTTAARVLGLSRSAAYRYASSGDLPTRHLGGRVYIVTALLIELISVADNREEVA